MPKKRARPTVEGVRKEAQRLKTKTYRVGKDIENFIRSLWRRWRKTAADPKAKHPVSGKGYVHEQFVKPVKRDLQSLFTKRGVKQSEEKANTIVTSMQQQLEDTPATSPASPTVVEKVVEKALVVTGHNSNDPEVQKEIKEIKEEELSKPLAEEETKLNSEGSVESKKGNIAREPRSTSIRQETSESNISSAGTGNEKPAVSSPAVEEPVTKKSNVAYQAATPAVTSEDAKQALESFKAKCTEMDSTYVYKELSETPTLVNQFVNNIAAYMKMLKVGVHPSGVLEKVKMDSQGPAVRKELKATDQNNRSVAKSSSDSFLSNLKDHMSRFLGDKAKEDDANAIVSQGAPVAEQEGSAEPESREESATKSLPTAAAPKKEVKKDRLLQEFEKEMNKIGGPDESKWFANVNKDHLFSALTDKGKKQEIFETCKKMKNYGVPLEAIFIEFKKKLGVIDPNLQIIVPKGGGPQAHKQTQPVKTAGLIDELQAVQKARELQRDQQQTGSERENKQIEKPSNKRKHE